MLGGGAHCAGHVELCGGGRGVLGGAGGGRDTCYSNLRYLDYIASTLSCLRLHDMTSNRGNYVPRHEFIYIANLRLLS